MISAAAALASASAPEAAVRVLMAPLELLLLRLRRAISSTSPINVTYDEEGQLRIFAVYAAQHTNWMEPKMLCHLILARGVWGQVGILIRFGGSQVKARGGSRQGMAVPWWVRAHGMMLLVRWNPLIHFCVPLVAHGQSGLLAQKRLAREEMLEERGGGGGPTAPRTERKILTVMSTLRALRNNNNEGLEASGTPIPDRKGGRKGRIAQVRVENPLTELVFTAPPGVKGARVSRNKPVYRGMGPAPSRIFF